MVAVAGVARGSAGVRSWLYLAVLPGLVGLVYGAERLRRRGGRTALLMAASLTAAAWAMTSVVGLMGYRDSVFVAFAAAPLLVVPLPVAAAARARPRERADRSAR